MTSQIRARARWARGIQMLRKFDGATVLTRAELMHYLGLSRSAFYRILFPHLRAHAVRGAALWYVRDILQALRSQGWMEGVR